MLSSPGSNPREAPIPLGEPEIAAADLGLRRKGGLGLAVFARLASGRVERLLPGARLLPGEVVRFEVTAERPGSLVLVGLDAARVVTPYVPRSGPALLLPAGRAQVPEGSILLDEALGPERFVAVLCGTPLDVAQVVETARAALKASDPRRIERLDLPCPQASFLIEKVRRR